MTNSSQQPALAARKWELDEASFQALLGALHANPADAGREYERLRRRLIQFFSIHGVLRPEEATDEAFNRLAKRIGEGQAIQNIEQYTAGIGRMLVLEERQRARRELESLRQLRLPSPQAAETDEMLKALEDCLSEVPEAGQRLLQRYYSASSRMQVLERERLAAEIGISLNSLRNRALRLRERLQLCVEKRMRNLLPRDVPHSSITYIESDKA